MCVTSLVSNKLAVQVLFKAFGQLQEKIEVPCEKGSEQNHPWP